MTSLMSHGFWGPHRVRPDRPPDVAALVLGSSARMHRSNLGVWVLFFRRGTTSAKVSAPKNTFEIEVCIVIFEGSMGRVYLPRFTLKIGQMYGKNQPHVGKYTIHACYAIVITCISIGFFHSSYPFVRPFRGVSRGPLSTNGKRKVVFHYPINFQRQTAVSIRECAFIVLYFF